MDPSMPIGGDHPALEGSNMNHAGTPHRRRRSWLRALALAVLFASWAVSAGAFYVPPVVPEEAETIWHVDNLRVASEESSAPEDAVPPLCVTDVAREHYAVPVYGRYEGGPDRYEEMAPKIREAVVNVNNAFYRETVEQFGIEARLKVLCEPGPTGLEMVVATLVVPVGSSVGAALHDQGFSDGHARHWVYVNGSGRGAATLQGDDSPGLANAHNHRHAHAVVSNMGLTDWLHEILHTMGAVQKSAPHSLGGYHCSDGPDIMCYDDRDEDPVGMLQGHNLQYYKDLATNRYDPTACLGEPYQIDCHHDDYYNPTPPEGSYLATHWNLAAPANCHMWFGAVDDLREARYEASGCRTLFDVDDDGTFPPLDCDDEDPAYQSECPNVRPFAVASAPRRAPAGSLVSFDGSQSFDPDGAVVAYRWAFDDGQVLEGVVVERTFGTVGATDVVLTVIDDRGAIDAARFRHVVQAPAAG